MSELWKLFPGDDRYEVSDLGRVRRADTGRIRKLPVAANGYAVVHLSILGTRPRKMRTVYVHEAVAIAFHGPRPPGAVVRHGRNGPLDNRASQLQWGTPKENCADRERDRLYKRTASV
jgi:hypothetical protein